MHVKLTLMDAQTGDVLRTYSLREGALLATQGSQESSDPWTFLSAEQKATTLRNYFESTIERGARELLTPP